MIGVFHGENDRRGWQLVGEGKFGEAIRYCDEQLKKSPDSAYYARIKGTALIKLEKYADGLECFDAIIEAFYRYVKENPPTAVDLLDITVNTMWHEAQVMLDMKRNDLVNGMFEQFFIALKSLEASDSKNNESKLEKRVVSPRICHYGAFAKAICGDVDGSLAYVKKVVAYWKQYFRYFGEPCNVDRSELIVSMKNEYAEEPVFSELKNDKRLWEILAKLEKS